MPTAANNSFEPAGAQLRCFVREAVVPHGWIDIALLTLIIATPLSMYLDAVRELPGATLATRTVFALCDTQYFDAFRSIAFFHGGEAAVLEHQGEGFLSFPLLPFMIPSLLFRLFGISGLYVSVAVLLWLAVVACRLMLRCAGLTATLAAACAGVMVIVPWAAYAGAGGTELLNLWFPRFGRPIGTLPQVLLSLAMLALIARSRGHRTHVGVWCILAAGIGMTLQGDLHSAVVLGLVALVAWIACGVQSLREGTLEHFAVLTIIAGAVAAVTLAPFFAARLLEDPGGPAHLGRMMLPRTRPFLDAGSIAIYVAIGIAHACIIAGIAWLHYRRSLPVDRIGHSFLVARHLPWMLVLAYFALPISIIVLGQGAQLFHFRDSIRLLVTIDVFFGAFLLIQLLIDPITSLLPRVRDRWRIAPSAIAAIALLVPTAAVIGPALFENSLPATPRGGAVPPGWRGAFIELTNFLASPACANDRVLATFDPNVYPVWVGMMGRNAFMSDILTTTLPDAVTERRLLEVCRLLSMSDADTEKFLSTFETLFHRLGQGKYVATRAYTLDPFEAYRPEDQKQIRDSPRDRAWGLMLSIPERQRLMTLYATTPSTHPSGRLDLIVLRPSDVEFGMKVPEDKFERVFKNDFFEVWRRRSPR